MGILTSKDMEVMGRELEPEKVNAPIPIHEIIEGEYILPTAPMGECNISFYHGNKTIQLKLKDQTFVIPENWNRMKKGKYERALIAQGFIKATAYKGVKVPEPEPEDEEDKILETTLAHPDNTEYEAINGNCACFIGEGEEKKEVILGIKDGLVKTEDNRVVIELLKSGYYITKQRIKGDD